jgi:hypothetical protein
MFRAGALLEIRTRAGAIQHLFLREARAWRAPIRRPYETGWVKVGNSRAAGRRYDVFEEPVSAAEAEARLVPEPTLGRGRGRAHSGTGSADG